MFPIGVKVVIKKKLHCSDTINTWPISQKIISCDVWRKIFPVPKRVLRAYKRKYFKILQCPKKSLSKTETTLLKIIYFLQCTTILVRMRQLKTYPCSTQLKSTWSQTPIEKCMWLNNPKYGSIRALNCIYNIKNYLWQYKRCWF